MVVHKNGEGDVLPTPALRKLDRRPTAVGLRQLTDMVLELSKKVTTDEQGTTNTVTVPSVATPSGSLDCSGQLSQLKRR